MMQKKERTKIGIDDKLSELFENTVDYIKKDFKDFSTKLAFFIPVVFVFFKSLWYVYQLGKYRIYNVDKSYISFNNDHIIMSVIQVLALVVIWGGVSYTYYSIATDNELTSLKKNVKLIMLYIVEMVGVFCFIFVQSNIKLSYFVKGVSSKDVIYIIVLIFFSSVGINMFGLMFSIRKIKKDKEIENNEHNEKNIYEQNKLFTWSNVKMFIGIWSLLLLGLYCIGMSNEYNRTAYKVVLCEIDEADISDSHIYKKYDNKIYEIYPIVYEDEDCFIICRLYKWGNENVFDNDYQKIIAKDGIETRIIYDIYDVE